MIRELLQEKAERDLDKEFNDAMMTVQTAIDRLHVLHKKFDDAKLPVAYSQLSQLRIARGSFTELAEEFKMLHERNTKN